ncbi:S-layer homology domain-containing protein [Leptolyngbya sp. KIOST-1]|uniref:S-layer homology domain-containing protein n=1 Tax=Leptolyngbya sp. KIOST-1 TaxID=1229172 RepID=UPI001CEDC35D|nr:S-layer homology domain-containing protein [Leptolyngbya sp. KIOST-1]
MSAFRPTALIVSGLSLLLVTGCAGSGLEQSLEADPQLQERPVFGDDIPETNTAATTDSDVTPPPDRSASVPTTGNAQTTGGTGALRIAQLREVPDDLRPFVQDWLALGLVEATQPAKVSDPDVQAGFEPNQPITRSEFAQWLLAANNAFYQDVPAQRIRPATASASPIFQDVPTSHPHFTAIQGLAEAGIIPSAKTGNATAVTFRPDAPLTRETLVLWKAPLDSRTTLPTATTEAVTAAWGFQDAAAIEPLALRAVLADHQIGDFSNIRRAFGYTTLFQPQQSVTQAEAAAAIWRFGNQTEGISAQDLLRQTSSPSGSPTSGQSTNSL